MSEVKQHIVDLADKLKDGLTIGAAGVATFSDEAFDRALEGRDVTKVQVQESVKLIGDVTAAGGYALGQAAFDAMKKDPDLESVTGKISAVKGLAFEFQVDKNYMVPNGDRENPGMVQNHGRVIGKVIISGTGNNGDHKKVRKAVREMFTNEFGE